MSPERSSLNRETSIGGVEEATEARVGQSQHAAGSQQEDRHREEGRPNPADECKNPQETVA